LPCFDTFISFFGSCNSFREDGTFLGGKKYLFYDSPQSPVASRRPIKIAKQPATTKIGNYWQFFFSAQTIEPNTNITKVSKYQNTIKQQYQSIKVLKYHKNNTKYTKYTKSTKNTKNAKNNNTKIPNVPKIPKTTILKY
jgi:hypothetical protein